jgi:hypothetical protein
MLLMSAPQFFGQKYGCLNQNCPFLHDRAAVLADRSRVLEERRKTFDYKHKPTARQQWTRYFAVMNTMTGNDEALRAQIEKSEEIDRGLERTRAFCANMRCMKPWLQEESTGPLKSCKGCKYTMYCSVSALESFVLPPLRPCSSLNVRRRTGHGIRKIHACP